MLEAANTSLQIHLKVSAENACGVYNISQALSAPMVAASANAPLLFGQLLWQETRIPLFEQSIRIDSFRAADGSPIGRATFGTGYAKQSLLEPFLENLDGYRVILPLSLDEDADQLPHLRLHNGTLWRWNRPLIGFSEGGEPHLRIEHRVCSAGPSIKDIIANIALYAGAAIEFAESNMEIETMLPFKTAKDNFYRAARYGLDAEIVWLDGKTYNIRKCLLEEVLPKAVSGLTRLGVDRSDIDYFLGEVLYQRLCTGQTGAVWQSTFVKKAW